MRQRLRWPMTINDDDKRFFEKLGGRIAALRSEHGLTQAELAACLGVSQQTINSFEKGLRRVPASALPELSKVLHVSVEELIDVYRSLMGEHDDWDAYRASMVADRRVVVRLRPTHVYGMLPTP